MLADMPLPVRRWHALVESRDPAGLDEFLADDAVFRSPAVHAPQGGKPTVTAYLTAALDVLGPSLTYHRQWWQDGSAVLEFTAEVEGREVHGVDLLRWDATGRVIEFTVMVRPLRGLEALVSLMGERLRA